MESHIIYLKLRLVKKDVEDIKYRLKICMCMCIYIHTHSVGNETEFSA